MTYSPIASTFASSLRICSRMSSPSLKLPSISLLSPRSKASIRSYSFFSLSAMFFCIVANTFFMLLSSRPAACVNVSSA